MAASDILNLKTSMGARLMRCLYAIALILIAVMVVLGLVRGVRTMIRTPPRPAIAQNQAPAPGAATPAPPRPGMMGPRRGPMMYRRFGRPGFRGPRGPLSMGPLPRNPMLAGAIFIVMTLLRGAIMLLVVRILAEVGLAVLAMPRRADA